MQIATFTDKLKMNYKYMLLPNGEADVFIYKFVEEKRTEDGKEYIYEFNQFRVKTDEISEKDVKANPLSFLDYSTKELSADEKIEKLEKEVSELREEIKELKKQ